MRYDVFISYSRKDYVDENENVLPDSPVKAIMEFLDKNNISYWIDKEGVYSSSQFVELITQAIRDSKMLLFVSSKHSNTSDYTAGEVKEARDTGKAIIPMRIDDTPYSESYRILINMIDHIEFSKPNAFPKLLSAITKEKERIAKVQAEVLLNKVLTNIREQIALVDNLHIAQHNLKKTIYEKLCSIGVTEKECPACHTKCSLDSEYCPVCGWHFYTFSCIPQLNVEIGTEEKTALANFSALLWNTNSNKDYKRLKSVNSSLEAELTKIKAAKAELTNVCNLLFKERDDLRSELRMLKPEKLDQNEHPPKSGLQKKIFKCFVVFAVSVVLIFLILWFL